MPAIIYVLTFADGKHYVGQTRRSLRRRLIEQNGSPKIGS
jgi:predicted GIY-YIG superfamily endonuclease